MYKFDDILYYRFFSALLQPNLINWVQDFSKCSFDVQIGKGKCVFRHTLRSQMLIL